MVDGSEVLPDVGSQHVAMAPCEVLQPLDGAVGAFPDTIGIAVGDEYALEARADHGAQGMVDDAITKASSTDLPTLGLVDEEMRVRAGPVFAASQFFTQTQQAISQAVLESRNRGVSALAPHRSFESRQQVRQSAKLVERWTREGKFV